MAGSSILGTNLVDSLVPGVIDGIRDALHPGLGVRAFRVYAVTRTYSGEFGGSDFVDTEVELVPQPLVESYVERTGTSLRRVLEPCGIDEAGVVMIKEVSFTYTEAEVAGPPANPDSQEFLIKIGDAHGQAVPDRYFQPLGPPYPDRIQGMGWQMRLVRSTGDL